MNDIKDTLKDLIRLLSRSEIEVEDSVIEESWIESRRASSKRKMQMRIRQMITAAAVIAAVVILSLLIDSPIASEPDTIELYALQHKPASDSKSKDIQLFLSEGDVMNIGTSETDIDYTCPGKVIVDADTLAEKSDDFQPHYNQLIVPYGKRTRLHLSDGSRLCVNSGSRVVYPLNFGVGDRKIYIDGEAYLEVAKDENRPFIVRTGDFEVKVLGTKFNVFAYQDADIKQVVLVDGSVEVDDYKTTKRLVPGQLIEKFKSGMSKPKNVAVESYISWVNNTIIYEHEPLESIFNRLHYYYGLQFDIKCDISRLYVSGKLNLPEEADDVLSSISFSVPVECSRDGNNVSVTAE